MGASAEGVLIAHLIFRLDVGGLENGLINLVNRLPADKYRHAIISLTTIGDFSRRIEATNVQFHALDKPPGNDPATYLRFWRLIRSLRPQVLHTRNLATLEYQAIAWLAGVPCRIHGEHGWDVYDPDGSNRRYRLLRRLVAPLVQRFIPMSQDLAAYLKDVVRVSDTRITQIYSGADTSRFRPRMPGETIEVPADFAMEGRFVIGSVGRLEPIKNQVELVSGFTKLVGKAGRDPSYLRLILVGDGLLRERIEAMVEEAGIAHQVWLAGTRDDVPALMRSFDLFVLPSINEGISNTILEAMSTGLPVVAARVGGNPELVAPGHSGALYESGDTEELANLLLEYAHDRPRCEREGQESRRIALQRFGIDRMVSDYQSVYDDVIGLA